MAKSVSDFRFAVFKRQDRDGWWFRYYITDKRRSSSLSVETMVKRMGLLDEYPKIRSKRQAEHVVMNAYNNGVIRMELGVREKLGTYLLDYWDFNGVRITRANKRRPNSISENYASIMQGYIRNHIIPLLKKNMEVADVSDRKSTRLNSSHL